jgi:alanine racemase
MFETDSSSSRLTVDLGAVQRNYRRVAAELGPGVECAAVVKADAYGLGATHVAPALAQTGARSFFVAQVEEGIALRPLLPDSPIFVLNGLQPGLEIDCEQHRLTPVLNSLDEIELWASHSRRQGHALPAAVHLDTGMNRLGLPAYEVARLIAEPERLQGFSPLLLLSHLACSDQAEHEANSRQLSLFQNWRRQLPPMPASFANSSGIFLGTDYHFDLVRPGASLYGVNPLPNHLNPMTQVLLLEGKILQVRDVDRGTTVGYGATHRIENAGVRLATVAIGYAEGYMRSASGRGVVFLGDHRVNVVGRVSMDLITVDVTGIPENEAHPGAWVELIGPHLDVDTVAERAGTIGYEILTSLGGRHRRRYLEHS